jgi:hypothetical protein
MKKDGIILALIAGIMILYSGCIGMTYDQTVSPDGSSMVAQELDMSGLITYIEKMSASMSASALQEPNLYYRASDYASLPDFGSAATGINVSETGNYEASFSNMTPGKTVYVSVSIHNSGNYSLSGMKISLFSDAVVPYSSYFPLEDDAGALGSGEDYDTTFAAEVANATPGTHYMTIIAVLEAQSYDAGLDMMTAKNVTVAKTLSFDVKPAPPAAGSDYESQFSSLCVNITRDNRDVNCSYSNGKLSLAKAIQPDGKTYVFSSEKGLFESSYSVRITELITLANSSEISGGSMASSGIDNWTGKFSEGFSSGTSASMMRNMMSIKYTVHMPAKIENYTAGGELSDDGRSVTYDVLDLYDKKRDIQITSREGDSGKMYLIIGGAVLLLIIIVGLVMPMLGKGKKQEKYEI